MINHIGKILWNVQIIQVNYKRGNRWIQEITGFMKSCNNMSLNYLKYKISLKNKEMINKNLDDISYKDIESLLNEKIDESDILDYKSEMINDEKLIKHVCAFANTRGGNLIFGVKESGHGGCPTKIIGVDSSISKERIEQVILSNIVPRLEIKIKLIACPDSTKSILLIRIPSSYLKPHQNNKDKKFYKRFQFESSEMSEQEICDCYKRRFTNHDQIEQYIDEISAYRTGVISTNTIQVNIMIIPSNIEYRLIDTSNHDDLDWLDSICPSPSIQYAPSSNFLPSQLEPFSHGLISKSASTNPFRQIRIHRNGCIQYVQNFPNETPDPIIFPSERFAVRLMQALQFTNKTLQHYNYFGDVRIIVKIACSCQTCLVVKPTPFPREFSR